jgi:quercetin dioxygenase-like cupin family protein
MSAPDNSTDLQHLAGELLERAAEEHARRAAHTLPHPVDGLRQTVIALLAGAGLGEHESPGPASLFVIRGHVRLTAGDDTVELAAHRISPIPDRRHSLHADEDSVVLLSVAVPQRAPHDAH